MSRDLNLDILRTFSIFAVILIHVTASYTASDFISTNISSWLVEFINQSLFWCVPVFFMLSGALLLNQHNFSIRQFYQKRMAKVLIPTLFWSGFFLAYLYIFKDFSLFNIVGALFKGKPFYHLWFMYAIIALYLFAPYIKILLSQLTSAQTRGLILLLFVFTIGGNYIGHYFDNQGSLFTSFLTYIGYFILGHELYKHRFSLNHYHRLFGILFFISIICGSFMTIYTLKILHLNVPLIAYYSPLIAFQAISLYLYILTRTSPVKKPDLWINLSLFSFGAYLIHPAFIILLEPYLTMGYLLYLPLFYILVLSCSYISVYFLKKIKYINNIV